MIAASTLLALALMMPSANAAEGGDTIKTGYLACFESSGWGFIFGSSRDVKCSYASKSGRVEYYTGAVSKFGADIGYLKSAVIVWAVAATTNDLHAAHSRVNTAAQPPASVWERARAPICWWAAQEIDRPATGFVRGSDRLERCRWRRGAESQVSRREAPDRIELRPNLRDCP